MAIAADPLGKPLEAYLVDEQAWVGSSTTG
jgi:hypothetical protein